MKRKVRQAMIVPTRLRITPTSPNTIAIAASEETIQEPGKIISLLIVGKKKCEDARLRVLLTR